MMAVYFATKAFVLSLSEAVGQELKNDNISITTLCPGPTHTNFGDESNMNASDVVKNVKIANPKDVAALGYKSMMKGRSTVIHGNINKLAPFAIRFIPRKWITKLSEKVMRQS
jgi:short-subunit dehydrogenase